MKKWTEEEIKELLDENDINTGLYDGKWFAIVPSWKSMTSIVIKVNGLNKDKLERFGCSKRGVDRYWEQIEQYGDLRLGRNGKTPMDDESPYLKPEGLIDFEEILEIAGIKGWGFADEYGELHKDITIEQIKENGLYQVHFGYGSFQGLTIYWTRNIADISWTPTVLE